MSHLNGLCLSFPIYRAQNPKSMVWRWREDRMRSVREAGWWLQGPSEGGGGTADGSGTPWQLTRGTELFQMTGISQNDLPEHDDSVGTTRGSARPAHSLCPAGGPQRGQSQEPGGKSTSTARLYDAPNPEQGRAGRRPGEPRRPRTVVSGARLQLSQRRAPKGW